MRDTRSRIERAVRLEYGVCRSPLVFSLSQEWSGMRCVRLGVCWCIEAETRICLSVSLSVAGVPAVLMVADRCSYLSKSLSLWFRFDALGLTKHVWWGDHRPALAEPRLVRRS